MPETFRCPSCNAPLKFQSTTVQTCKFCGCDVIVPADFSKPGEIIPETAPPPKDEELLRNTSELGQKALKIAEIKRALKQNKTTNAAILFRDSFGGSLADARDIVRAIEKGESIGVPDLQSNKKPSIAKWIILFIIFDIVIILVLIFGTNLFR